MIHKARQVKNARQSGQWGEEIARKYLERKGYRFLEKNFHIRGGELDLVLENDGIIVFVEVKLRTSKNFGEGCEALTRRKKQKLLRTIFSFLQSGRALGFNIRGWQLDLLDISVDKVAGKAFIHHLPNILEA